jgi:deoxyribodipyrimidine photo-lyase
LSPSAPTQTTPDLDTALMWFRRDLRAHDNAALFHALKRARRVHCVFVFDREILDVLPRADRRVEFIRESLVDLDQQLRAFSAGRAQLIVRHGWPLQQIPELAAQVDAQAVFTNHDDEPAALKRDAQVRAALAEAGKSFFTSKDHTIFERKEVLTLAGQPFTVFTPFKNAWLKKINAYYLKSYPIAPFAANFADASEHARGVPTLAEIGFEATNLKTLAIPTGTAGGTTLLKDFWTRIDNYGTARDFPAVKGVSYLSVHHRFGTISIREAAREAHARWQAGSAGALSWLNELIWRDFYFQILANFPHAAQSSFKPIYDTIEWESGKRAEALFAAWCEARTGYPLVDAAMQQLNQTGYMHNRLRMVVASFLTKDLGIDWRWGERYFAEKLNDFDLAANNGGWQWAASSGCDAQPYFRIFNPTSQSEKFDAEAKFIRRYLPQLASLPNSAIHAPWLAKPMELQAAGFTRGKTYPDPIVDHATERERTLARYAVVKKA